MRPIDADLLKERISSYAGMLTNEGFFVNLQAVLNGIELQPTIQPQINRGKWIRYEDTHEDSVKYICPFCGDYTAFRGEIAESTVNGNYIYCRHCGAKNGEDQ